MTPTILEDAVALLAAECPRRILGVLHERGVYRHYTVGSSVVRCFHYLSPLPKGAVLTPAQDVRDALSAPPEGRVADDTTKGVGW